MSKVSYVLEFTVKDGMIEDFKAKAKSYIATVRDSELGTLGYNWYLQKDGQRCLLHETFTDSAALLTHLGNVGPSLPELVANAPIKRFEVFGTASAVVVSALASFGAVHFPHFGGFDR